MTEQRNDNSGLWSGLIGLILALLVGGLALFSAWKNAQKAAKLLHERDLAVEKTRRAVSDVAVAELEEVKQAAWQRASDLATEAKRVQEELDAAVAARQAALDKIDQITSWDSFKTVRVNEAARTDPDNSVPSSNDQG